MSKSATPAWEFLEDLDEKTTQQETARDNRLSFRFDREGMHFVSNASH